MIDLDIEVDTRDAELYVRGVHHSALPVAEVRSLNKVIVTVRKEAVPLIHARRRLPKRDIKKQMTLVRATRNRREARVMASRRPIPLKRYAAKWSGRKGNKRVVVNVSGDKQILRHAFIVDRLGGHVFARTGQSRLPIEKQFGPSLGSALVNEFVTVSLRAVVARRWPIVFQHEVEYAISRIRRR